MTTTGARQNRTGETMEEKILSMEDIAAIPADLCPMLCFADNPRALFGFLVKTRTRGVYSHFQWLLAPGQIATQGFSFHQVPAVQYAGYHLKFVYSRTWTPREREILRLSIEQDLKRPWYKTRYDFAAIVGQALGIRWIQNPRLQICSDTAAHLRWIEPGYDLRWPTPSDVNAWTKARSGRYRVFGRYFPD